MKKVYIVDDSIHLRKRLKDLLSDAESVRIVGSAGCGGDALESIGVLHPDTVVLDIRMPGKNGIETLKEIKASWPDIAVIIMTNYDYPHYRRMSMAAGADYFFNKTREFERLLDVLRAG